MKSSDINGISSSNNYAARFFFVSKLSNDSDTIEEIENIFLILIV
jgi:hypothetical protein